MKKPQLIASLKSKGFPQHILKAFAKVKRENFIPKQIKERAYEDNALPIGHGQTISQPYTIAEMLNLLDLKPSQKVLEVGSGCGYVLALLSEIVNLKGQVYGIEIIKELAEKSKQNLRGYNNIQVFNQDGKKGLKEYASFDRILISAAHKKIPNTLLSQLKDNGIIVAPLGGHDQQSLVSLKNKKMVCHTKRNTWFYFCKVCLIYKYKRFKYIHVLLVLQ